MKALVYRGPGKKQLEEMSKPALREATDAGVRVTKTTFCDTDGKAVEKVMAMTDGKGVDVAIEAVGIAPTFEMCQHIVGPGGHIANIGVHGASVTLRLEKLWSHNITITTRLVDAVTTPLLLKTVMAGKLKPKQLITHHFALDDILKAYDTFGNAAKERALKVILTN
ncbi:MAG TPA: zinc-binding dehydrogenase [Verrucomicrobiae bacterium]